MTTPYDADLYTWTREQAAALRAKRWDALDVAKGNEQAHAVESHLANVLTHLLKWTYQPQRRSRGCQNSGLVGRQQIARRLRRSPDLRPELPILLADAYRDARKRAMQETALPLATFSEQCPWSLEQVLDEDFWPAP